MLCIFRKAGGLLEGHFLLTSGLHSGQYFQCARVLQYPRYARILCGDIAAHFKNEKIDVVIAPAIGGIVVAQEVGRQLKKRTIFAEREKGTMMLRRGFHIDRGENVLVVEDVITTGGSVREVMDVVTAHEGNIVGIGVIVNRSGRKARFKQDFHSVVHLSVVMYSPGSCPYCKEGKPLVKPGSRNIKT